MKKIIKDAAFAMLLVMFTWGVDRWATQPHIQRLAQAAYDHGYATGRLFSQCQFILAAAPTGLSDDNRARSACSAFVKQHGAGSAETIRS